MISKMGAIPILSTEKWYNKIRFIIQGEGEMVDATRANVCPSCHMVVAPGDPDRVLAPKPSPAEGGIYHGPCWRSVSRRNEASMAAPSRREVIH